MLKARRIKHIEGYYILQNIDEYIDEYAFYFKEIKSDKILSLIYNIENRSFRGEVTVNRKGREPTKLRALQQEDVEYLKNKLPDTHFAKIVAASIAYYTGNQSL